MNIHGLIVEPEVRQEELDSFTSQNREINRLYVTGEPSDVQKGLRRDGRLKILSYDRKTDFATLVENPSASKHYVDEIARKMAQLDGVLFGWRAPGFDSTTGKDSKGSISEGMRYVTLLSDVRKVLGKEKEIAVCLPVSQPHVRRIMTVLNDMKPHINFFIISGFDGDWMVPRACHVSPLHPLIDSAVKAYTRVLLPEKIIIGLPSSATIFEDCGGFDRSFSKKTQIGSELGSTTLVRDVTAGCMPCLEDTNQVTVFEDSISLAVKRQYILDTGLAGVAFLINLADFSTRISSIWEKTPPRPPRSDSLTRLKDPAPPNPSPPKKRKRTESFQSGPAENVEDHEEVGKIIDLFGLQAEAPTGRVSEWSAHDSFDVGDVVAIGKRVFRCRIAHMPSFPTLRPDLWEESNP